MNKGKYLYIIAGPTASGKTQKALDLASEWNTEIISADSRQFYKEMNIGTAKPSNEQLKTVPHHFISNISIHDTYDAGKYEKEVLVLLDQLFNKYDRLIMVGGSGLFIKAITSGFDAFPAIDTNIREELQAKYSTEGIEILQKIVSDNDPEYYARVDIYNHRRLQRAAEIILQTGRAFSSYQSSIPKERDFNIVKNIIELPREQVYNQINKRVLDMIEQGLEAEAMSLYPFRNLRPLQTVGYNEWYKSAEGIYSRDKAIELIQQNTRNYAKRQMTWFRNDGGWKVLK
ncbi:MAG TPA: tRNA (adenosine(37)-N6)-dimethylallyltransferase MiaA [Saprospiraceae bacterium]|nr:tRNA (adenosine(37)-N6)-dimethylallyltransferase MiaA [Saprospiraceae bacterium]